MRVWLGARSDPGGRANNEDSLAVVNRDHCPEGVEAIAVVADGMGGCAGGEDASAIAVKMVRDNLSELLGPPVGQAVPAAEDALAAALRRANSRIFELSKEYPETKGMGTTCIAAVIAQDRLTFGHVGDSRAYLLRGGVFKPITRDHTFVADQVRSGNLSSEEAKKSKFRSVITRAIGIEPTVSPDIESYDLHDSDVVLICTDGLINALDEDALVDLLKSPDTPQEIADSLIESANEAGAKDNVTALVMRLGDKRQTVNGAAAQRLPKPESPRNGAAGLSPAMDRSNGSKAQALERQTPEQPLPETAYPRAGQVRATSVLIGGVVGAVAVAIAGLSALIGLGWLSESSSFPYFGPRPISKPQVALLPSYTTLAFGQPEQILYKPLSGDVLQLCGNNVLVCAAVGNTLLLVGPSGQILTRYAVLPSIAKQPQPVPGSSAAVPSRAFVATDSAGDVYLADSAARSITQFDSLGRVVRRVAAGQLTAPASLAVDRTGDIFVIDGSYLKVIRPVPALPVRRPPGN